jgi:hypothetical protein
MKRRILLVVLTAMALLGTIAMASPPDMVVGP